MLRFSALIILFCFCSCQQKKLADPLTAETDLAAAQSDFRLFRDILEDAHPALTEYISTDRKNFLFDSVYKTIDKKLSVRELYKKLAFLINETGCSHTFTSLPTAITDTLYNRKLFFPFPAILLNDELYINADDELPHGTKILSVNGIPISRILDSLMLYNPVEGFHRETQRYATAGDFGFDYYVHFGVPKKFELLLKDTSGKIETQLFDPVTLDELTTRKDSRYYYDATDVIYSFSINEETGYALLRLTDFEIGSSNQQAAFESFLKNSFELLSKKKEIRHLIIDLRENTGGDLYNCFLLHSYLAKNPFPEYKRVFSRVRKISYEDYLSVATDFADIGKINTRLKREFLARSPYGYYIPDSLIDSWEPDPLRFTGSTYIITNHKVASAASYFILLTKNNGTARVIGTETCGGGYSGNGFRMLEYQLPASGIRFNFPYAKMIYSYNERKTGRGLIPDYAVPDTYSSFIKNEDCQLLYINDSLILKNK